MEQCIIVGAGIAGLSAARMLAEAGKQVMVLEKRPHIGGNCYDEREEHGILIHRYGPHIFHTKHPEVWEFLSRFTDWRAYEHTVSACVGDRLLPIPFNLNTLTMVFAPEKAKAIEKRLLEKFGYGARVNIRQLYAMDDALIRETAAWIYTHFFLTYTQKQWGQSPEEISPEVIGRVPVVLSHDDRYFQDPYQGMPLDGYTEMFRNMVDHPNITVQCRIDSREVLTLRDGGIYYEGKPFTGDVIYTGMTDELFGYRYSPLSYRSLRLAFEYHPIDMYQPCAVVNYTINENYTRITEFRHMTGQKADGTVILKEYPIPFRDPTGEIPYYVVSTEESRERYAAYRTLAADYPRLHLLGRLAEYAYYNMDEVVLQAIRLTEKLR